MLWGHSISVCTLIHLYAAGLFLSLKKSMWFFSTTRPQNWTHNCQGVQCFNQCFNSLGHIPLEQVSLEILCLKPNVCSQVVELYECPEFGISFEYSFFLSWLEAPNLFFVYLQNFLKGLSVFNMHWFFQLFYLSILSCVYYLYFIPQGFVTTLTLSIYDQPNQI